MRLAIPAILTILTTAPLLAQPCATVAPDTQPTADFPTGPTYAALAHFLMLKIPTPDIPKMAPLDREFVLHCGSPLEAARVWAAVKRRPVTFPSALVIAAGPDSIEVAVSDEAIRTRKADYIFHPAAPLASIPPVGSLVEISGTYTSYASEPILIVMSNATVTPALFDTPKHRRSIPASSPPQK